MRYIRERRKGSIRELCKTCKRQDESKQCKAPEQNYSVAT